MSEKCQLRHFVTQQNSLLLDDLIGTGDHSIMTVSRSTIITAAWV